MTLDYLAIFMTRRGKYKVMMVGQLLGHIMDWRGYNFRRLALPPDLRRQFAKPEDAKDYLRQLKRCEPELKEYAAKHGDGAWFDNREML